MLSIIVVNYKSERETILYVKNELIKVQTPHIIVIVNNEATEEKNLILVKALDAELITDITIKPNISSKIFVVSHLENLGFAKGNNLGAEFSQRYFNVSFFLFSNNDIRFIDSDVTEQLINAISTKHEIALIGPRIIGTDGKNQSPEPYYKFWNRYILMYWLAPFLSIKKKNKMFKFDYSQNACEGEHYKVMGSFFIVKAEDFIKCGMMDPNTFLYAEEVILSERLRSIGKKVHFYPRVAVLHEHGKTISAHFDKKNKSLAQFSSESYYYKNYRNISGLSLYIGKVSFHLYLKLKKRKKKL